MPIFLEHCQSPKKSNTLVWYEFKYGCEKCLMIFADKDISIQRGSEPKRTSDLQHGWGKITLFLMWSDDILEM